jgi:4-amino-4-deoxy-L-arabinose transferase-like glycosyltransferase
MRLAFLPKPLGALLLLALALRVAAAANTAVINHDGARFTMSARAIRAGDWETALNVEPRMPPLYPIAIAALSTATGSLGLAGVIISVLCGTLLVVPVYLLARAIWDGRVAFLAGLVVAILPDLALNAGDVWTEPLFFLLFFVSAAATWFAGERPALWKFAVAGIAGGLAVLTRPEGLYTFAAILGWGAIVAWIRRREPEGRALRVAGPLLAALIWIAVLFPYANWIHQRFGFWSPTANQFAVKLLGRPNVERSYTDGYRIDATELFESGRDQKALGRVPGLAWNAIKTYLRAGAYVFPFLLLLGFFYLRRSAGLRRGVWFLILLGLGYAIPTWIGQAVGLPFDDRFALPTFVALAPVIAIGMMGAWERLSARWTPDRRGRLGAVAAALLVLGCSVKCFQPRDQRRLSLADAGRWIRENYGPDRRILTMDRRVEHYADAWSERVPPTFEETRRLVAAQAPVAIVLYDPYMDRHEPEFEAKLAAAYPKVHTIPKGDRGHEVRIYEVK